MKQYTRIVWSINIIIIILSYFFDNTISVSVLLFVAIIPAFAVFIIKTKQKEFDSWGEFFHGSSRLLVFVAALCIVYTFANFLVNFYILRNGGPNIVNGEYYLWNHEPIKQISEVEYHTLKLAEARLFSGQLLLFSTIPMVYFTPKRSYSVSISIKNRL